MKANRLRKGLAVLMATAFIGFSSNVFAVDGGQTGPVNQGKKAFQGKCPMMGKEAGMQKMRFNLTPEETELVKAERDAFREATRDLREDIYQKRIELQAEMAKENPDQKSVMDVHNQLTDLNARMGQKRIEHRLNLKQINPELGSGMGKSHGRCKGARACCPAAPDCPRAM